MASRTQKINNRTRLFFIDESGKIVTVYEFARKHSHMRRFFKAGNENLTCKVEHGNWD